MIYACGILGNGYYIIFSRSGNISHGVSRISFIPQGMYITLCEEKNIIVRRIGAVPYKESRRFYLQGKLPSERNSPEDNCSPPQKNRAIPKVSGIRRSLPKHFPKKNISYGKAVFHCPKGNFTHSEGMNFIVRRCEATSDLAFFCLILTVFLRLSSP